MDSSLNEVLRILNSGQLFSDYISDQLKMVLDRSTKLINNPKLFDLSLDMDQIGSMDHQDRLKCLSILATRIVDQIVARPIENQLKQTLNILLSKWCSSSDPDDISGVIGDLTTSDDVSNDTLFTIISIYSDITPIEIIESQLESNPIGVNMVINRLAKIYPGYSLSATEIEYLISRSESNQSSQSVITLLKSKLIDPENIAEVPVWVSLAENETPEILNYNLWKSIKPVESSVKPAVDMDFIISNFNFESSDSKDKSVDMRKISQVIETASSLSPQVDITQYPTDPDRMFGPVNKRFIMTDREAEFIECVSGVIDGGCRMLTCSCQILDTEDDSYQSTNPNDWFQGYCHECSQIISNISYAIRYPIIDQGWVGCYCSLECSKKGDIKPEDEVTSCRQEILADGVYSIIESKGIVDRLRLVKPDQLDQEIEFSISESSKNVTFGTAIKDPIMLNGVELDPSSSISSSNYNYRVHEG